MDIFAIGQELNVALTGLGNCAPETVCLYTPIGAIIFVCYAVYAIRKQILARRVLIGASAMFVCTFLNPLWFLPYSDNYQTLLLSLMLPLAMIEIYWKEQISFADLALINVPIWHWSFVFWAGCMNAA